MHQVTGRTWRKAEGANGSRAHAWRALAALAVALVVSAVLAPAAFAHSVLIGTQPGNDVVVPESPDEVVLEFNEAVDASLGSLRVFDGQGMQVDEGEVSQPAATEVAVGLEPDLAPGTYTVAWRVVSADSDPISGAFVFHVVERGVAANISVDALTGTSQAVDVLFTAGRFLDFAFLLLAAGGSAVLVIALPSAAWSVRRRLYGLLAAWSAALAVVALFNILLQGATAGGLPLSDAFSWSLFTSVLETDFGEVMLIQSALAVTLALTALALRHAEDHDRRPLIALTLALSVGLTLTPSFAGHARTLGALGLTSDILHVVSAALWTGGLAFVVLALLIADERWPLATRCVPRFSNLAVGSVVVLLTAGAISAYLQLRTWSAFWETEYGLLVLAKIALVVPLLALGAFNNRYSVPCLKGGTPSVLERRRFLRAVGAELAIMTVIVGVTAVLVNQEPARMLAMEMEAGEHGAMEGETPAAGPFEGTVMLGDTEAMVMVDPAAPGDNTITVMFMGAAEQPSEVRISASLPSQGIGPLDFTAEPDPEEQGSYVVEGASLSIAGDWELRIEALMGEFDLLTETIVVPIRGG